MTQLEKKSTLVENKILREKDKSLKVSLNLIYFIYTEDCCSLDNPIKSWVRRWVKEELKQICGCTS